MQTVEILHKELVRKVWNLKINEGNIIYEANINSKNVKGQKLVWHWVNDSKVLLCSNLTLQCPKMVRHTLKILQH